MILVRLMGFEHVLELGYRFFGSENNADSLELSLRPRVDHNACQCHNSQERKRSIVTPTCVDIQI